MFFLCNKNPSKKITKHNIISAVAILFCLSWKTAKSILEYVGAVNKEDVDSIANLDMFLKSNDYKPIAIETKQKYTVADFINEHTEGCYMLLTNDHAIPVIDSVYYDYYDSKNEAVIMCWGEE